MSGYAVKEMFVTLQGEGLNTGRRALFIRFAGCNLWSGREQDRAQADCTFCDTDFVGMDGDGGGRFADETALALRGRALWDAGLEERVDRGFVVLTGGEPLLQVDVALIRALHEQGFEIALETNGTLPVPDGIDWICVSPKLGTEIVQRRGNELKLVWPQPGINPAAIEAWEFDHYFVSAMDGPSISDNRASAIRFVMQHPRWRLSVQTHKILGMR